MFDYIEFFEVTSFTLQQVLFIHQIELNDNSYKVQEQFFIYKFCFLKDSIIRVLSVLKDHIQNHKNLTILGKSIHSKEVKRIPMISKVRLQRKFNPKSRFNYQDRIMLVCRILIVFELFLLLLTCAFNLSLQFHLDQIFTCQFWTDPQVKHYNLAIIITCILLCPYLIYIEKITVALVKDCYFTVLVLHSVFGFVQNQRFEFGYLIFVTMTGYLISSIAQYAVMMVEQKKLIDQINQIQAEDRKQIRFEQSQFASLTSFQLSDSK